MQATLLALDTSTDRLSLAVCSRGQVCLHESAGGALASQHVLPEALALLARAGCRLSDCDAVAFGAGPGAFTGLRTACAVAQGLALGAGLPVLALDSLMLVASDASAQLALAAMTTVWVAMDARMDEIYAAAYRQTAPDGPWQVVVAPALMAVADLQQRWQAEPPAVLAGSALGVFGARLGLPSTTLQLAQAQSRAAALARLALLQWQLGQGVDAALALPVYLRDQVAQTMAQRAALLPPDRAVSL
jgi:tRNA threonylcarbamoyladenosine biosynthesis protein TsaB